MINVTGSKFPPLSKGATITLAIPSVDRGPLDFRNLTGVIMDCRNSVYQVGTTHGVIKGWFPRTDLQETETGITLSDVPSNVFLSLREAAGKQSFFGKQGHKHCNCKQNAKKCETKRCACFKANLKCNSRCHNSNSCTNK